MSRLLLSVLLFTAVTRADDLAQQTAEIEARLSAITGLAFKHPVPYAVINRGQLRQYLNEKIRQTLKPEDVRIQEAVLKMLGLVPNDFDLKTMMVDLLTEQAAAFYDYHKKKLFLLDNNVGPDRKQALVHELAHALADQNFRLDKYIQESGRSDDSEAARLAVMEGQASWLMTAYMANSGADIPEFVLRDRQDLLTESASDYPVFAKAPLYIRVSLVFPYAEGLLFQDALYRRYGRESFSRVFRNPPVTTHQILHPEAYMNQPPPKLPLPPEPPPNRRHLRKQAEGALGEIDVRVLLVQNVGKEQGEAAAAHLDGGTYAYYEDKQRKNSILTVATSWDSADDAQRFCELYRAILAKKWLPDPSGFQLVCEGTRVSSIEGSLNLR